MNDQSINDDQSATPAHPCAALAALAALPAGVHIRRNQTCYDDPEAGGGKRPRLALRSGDVGSRFFTERARPLDRGEHAAADERRRARAAGQAAGRRASREGKPRRQAKIRNAGSRSAAHTETEPAE